MNESQDLHTFTNDQLEEHFLNLFRSSAEKEELIDQHAPDELRSLAAVVAGHQAKLSSCIDDRQPLASRNLEMIADDLSKLRGKILARANGEESAE